MFQDASLHILHALITASAFGGYDSSGEKHALAPQAQAQHTRWCWLTHDDGGAPTVHWSWSAPDDGAWVQLGRSGKAMRVEHAMPVALPSLRVVDSLGAGTGTGVGVGRMR